MTETTKPDISQSRVGNLLSREKSPYLLQHADNPVDWLPWGDEAFRIARSEERMIFLSVGYSTCHWCHVMAHESFEDEQVGEILRQNYIAIKVDREERPDIDQVYMEMAQRITGGGGGWPLTIIMTPEALPVFAGTYIPKNSRGGHLGLIEILTVVAKRWQEDPHSFHKAGGEIVGRMRQSEEGCRDRLTPSVLTKAEQALRSQFDANRGGFGNAPKFPRPHNISFLLFRYYRTGSSDLLNMATVTLNAMMRGGIHDHLAGGFHRYATDQEWLVPHFEKMLYDQAGVANAYLEAFAVTGNENYAETARGVFTYLLRDLFDSNGAFYCAEDADSEGIEGKFYVWEAAEIDMLLSKNDADLFKGVYSIEQAGNYREEVPGHGAGGNIPHMQQSVEEHAGRLGIGLDTLRDRLSVIRQQLMSAREERVRPHLDDKILTCWNGLMISALAQGAVLLSDAQYGEAAKRAARFILDTLQLDNGRLLRRYRNGETGIGAFAEDYAALALALFDLYRVDYEPDWLTEGLRLANDLACYFTNSGSGLLYDTANDAETLILRPQTLFDGAYPSANSMALELYTRAFALTGDIEWRNRAEGITQGVGAQIDQYPLGYTRLLRGFDLLEGSSAELVIVGEMGDATVEEILNLINSVYRPELTVLLKTTAHERALAAIAPFTNEMKMVGGKATVYLCGDGTCSPPVTDVENFKKLLVSESKME